MRMPRSCTSGEEGLRYQVERLLDSVDAVCYVLDYTKLRTAEEASIFARLKSINPGLVKRLSRRCVYGTTSLLSTGIVKLGHPGCALTTSQSTPDALCRLFFVVNKMDMIRTSEGLGEEATRQYVAQLVTQQLSGDGNNFQLHPEQVLLQCLSSIRLSFERLISCTGSTRTLSADAGFAHMDSIAYCLRCAAGRSMLWLILWLLPCSRCC